LLDSAGREEYLAEAHNGVIVVLIIIPKTMAAAITKCTRVRNWSSHVRAKIHVAVISDGAYGLLIHGIQAAGAVLG
jgi:hypothetical protein